jgi:hypothetical protein
MRQWLKRFVGSGASVLGFVLAVSVVVAELALALVVFA